MAPPLPRQLHESSLCPYRPLECRLGCMQMMRAVDLEYHHVNLCQFRVVRAACLLWCGCDGLGGMWDGRAVPRLGSVALRCTMPDRDEHHSAVLPSWVGSGC